MQRIGARRSERVDGENNLVFGTVLPGPGVILDVDFVLVMQVKII